MAGVLEHPAVALRNGDFDSPWPVPRRRIFNGELIDQRIGIGAAETLGKLQILAASSERILVRKILRFDDERVAVPAAARVPLPKMDVLWKMRTVIQRDHADFMSHLDE